MDLRQFVGQPVCFIKKYNGSPSLLKTGGNTSYIRLESTIAL